MIWADGEGWSWEIIDFHRPDLKTAKRLDRTLANQLRFAKPSLVKPEVDRQA